MGAPCHIDWAVHTTLELDQLNLHQPAAVTPTPVLLQLQKPWETANKPWQILVTIPNKYSCWFGQILFLLSLNQVWCDGPLCLNDFDSCFTNKESESSIGLASVVFLEIWYLWYNKRHSESGHSLLWFHQLNKRFQKNLNVKSQEPVYIARTSIFPKPKESPSFCLISISKSKNITSKTRDITSTISIIYSDFYSNS